MQQANSRRHRRPARAGRAEDGVIVRCRDRRTGDAFSADVSKGQALGLHALLVRVRDEYGPPQLYVTENGAAYADRLRDGRVDDPARVSFLERHVTALARALEDGVPVRGYFVWSLLDNFEWSFGYSRRFGIVYVDRRTLERIPKSSYAWYRQLIADRRAAAAPVG